MGTLATIYSVENDDVETIKNNVELTIRNTSIFYTSSWDFLNAILCFCYAVYEYFSCCKRETNQLEMASYSSVNDSYVMNEWAKKMGISNIKLNEHYSICISRNNFIDLCNNKLVYGLIAVVYHKQR